MSLDTLLTHPVTVHLRAETLGSGDELIRDRYGNPVLEDVDLELTGYFEQRAGQEDDVDAQTAGADYLVMLPARYVVDVEADEWADLPLDHVAAVTFGDLTLEVVGPPWRVYNPRRRAVSHVEARARRTV